MEASDEQSKGRNERQKHPAMWRCPLCPQSFTRNFNLQAHLRVHLDERPFACSTCGKAFSRAHDCKMHEALHSSTPRPFQCKGKLSKLNGEWGCGRQYARATHLSRHLRSKRGSQCLKPLQDEESTDPEGEIVPSTESASRNHGVECTCCLCLEQHNNALDLRTNVQDHTYCRSFVCEFCDRSFTREGDLKRHESLECSGKKFVCHGPLKGRSVSSNSRNWGCGRRFASPDALISHLRSQIGEVCIEPLIFEELREWRVAMLDRKHQHTTRCQPEPHQAEPQTVDPSTTMDGTSDVVSSDGMRLPAALLQQHTLAADISCRRNLFARPGSVDNNNNNESDGSTSFRSVISNLQDLIEAGQGEAAPNKLPANFPLPTPSFTMQIPTLEVQTAEGSTKGLNDSLEDISGSTTAGWDASWRREFDLFEPGSSFYDMIIATRGRGEIHDYQQYLKGELEDSL